MDSTEPNPYEEFSDHETSGVYMELEPNSAMPELNSFFNATYESADVSYEHTEVFCMIV